MIKFESITYRNILSVGQAPLVMDLSTHRLTALSGPSGSGKSLFLDALSFALFGRAFRDINKTELINSINGKDLLVELTFSIGSDRYQIRRGLKPNVFEILLNGTALNQDSHTKDQQKCLEDQILKMNWKIFTHVVMLGAANYTPFMRLKPGERKKMVENILGIDVFSTMNAVVKTKISDETLKYKGMTDRRNTLAQQVQYLEQQQKSFEEKTKEEVATLTKKLVGLRDRKKDLDQEILCKEQELEMLVESFDANVEVPDFTEIFNLTFTEEFSEEFNETFEEQDPAAFDVSELVSERATKLAEIKSSKEKLEHNSKHLNFYAEHHECPTCSQPIDDEFKRKSTDELEQEKVQLESLVAAATKVIDSIKVKAEEVQRRKKEYTEARELFMARKADFNSRKSAYEERRRAFEDKRRAFEARLRAHEEKVRSAQELVERKKKDFEAGLVTKRKALEDKKLEVTALLTEAKLLKEAIEEKKSKPLLDNSGEILRLGEEVSSLESDIDYTAKKVKLLREAQVIIKDDGVKSEILKRYVPTLNRYINQYLTKMGMFVSFELDEEFNDTIRSRHRDVLSYANYSEGERQRLDLAVLLAWRHLAQAQSAVNTNLLILDEVLDSYLDQGTTETILSLLKGDDFQSFNIFIISHKDGLSENFDQTLHFQKRNNFTSASLGNARH